MALNSSSQEMVKTREQVKEERKEQKNTEENASSKQRVRVRLFPIWLRIIVIILIMAVSLLAGAVIGYSVMGDGKASDTFKKDTWTHIVNLINEE
ncbi:DNA-directed RNA polymerase subunit beta [Niallia sp. FSL W8-0635]|uniref:DNA-directed RNA polymerase subunit beta n=1 Tax=Niallia sp. FSL W8-0635 TaxID=2975337 RepID=UPI0009CB0862|nr:DNA-directed RNA polymerase subunit beta [Mycobacteroides abscessus subsp. abscessus]